MQKDSSGTCGTSQRAADNSNGCLQEQLESAVQGKVLTYATIRKSQGRLLVNPKTKMKQFMVPLNVYPHTLGLEPVDADGKKQENKPEARVRSHCVLLLRRYLQMQWPCLPRHRVAQSRAHCRNSGLLATFSVRLVLLCQRVSGC
jgi:hypothetical protein